MHELRLRIRSEAEAQKKQQDAIRPQWLPQQLRGDKHSYQAGNVLEPAEGLKQEQDLPGENFLKWKTSTIGAEELAEQTTKDPIKREQLASFVSGDRDQLPLTWEELVDNSVTVRKRKHGKDYSESWHKNVRQTIERIPFGPEEVTPVKIREFMDLLETKYDQRGATIKNRLSALQGLFTNAIKSGYRPDLAPNPFDMVDGSGDLVLGRRKRPEGQHDVPDSRCGYRRYSMGQRRPSDSRAAQELILIRRQFLQFQAKAAAFV